jgi:16S rRNA (guanine527-N7)-methyltransferase
MEIAQFKLALSQLGLAVNAQQMAQLEQYARLVEQRNRQFNLTAHDTLELIYEKGIYDSLAFLLPYWQTPATLIDLGSGAGFPGIPLKIMYPNLTITLLEPTLKKAHFLQEVVTTLGLTGITVQSARAEVLARNPHFQPMDLVVARAVASLPILLELSLPLLKVEGFALLYKGKDYLAEIADSKNALHVLHGTIEAVQTLRLPTDHEQRSLLVVKKNQPTPLLYPRMFSQIKKTPL